MLGSCGAVSAVHASSALQAGCTCRFGRLCDSFCVHSLRGNSMSFLLKMSRLIDAMSDLIGKLVMWLEHKGAKL